MARRALELNRGSGPAAAAIAAGLVLAALVAVALRAEGQWRLGPADIAALRFTLVQALISAALSTIFAIPVARALSRRRFIGRGLLITLLGAPFILPVIVAVLGLLAVFGRAGWVSDLLGVFGFEPISIYGLHGVVLAHVFFNIPLATRLILQGWQSVPAERFRLAAQIGMSTGTIFRVIEWTMLLRILPGAFMLIFVLCLTSFAVALTLGGGPRATTIELAIYQAFRFDFDLGRAALLSMLQLGVAGIFAALALWLVPVSGLLQGMDRPVRRWDANAPGLRLIDFAAIALAALFLLLPIFAVVLAGLAGLGDLPATVWRSAWTSLWVAALSVLVLLCLALPMAGWLATRRIGGMEAAGILGLAASPLMIGTGWFILLNPVANPAVLAMPVTALVNALMALPFALRIVMPAMRDVLGDYGNLAQSVGLRGPSLWRILLFPRLRRQVGLASGLTAALSAGDLGVVALFADPSQATLPLQMYRLMGAYRMDAAASAALLLLVMALALFWVGDAWGRRDAES